MATTQETMTVEKLGDLVQQFRDSKPKLDAARDRVHQAQAEVDANALGRQYDSIESYIAARQRLNAAKLAQEEANDAYKAVLAEDNEIQKQLIRWLPSEIWIRFGDVGVGVAYTNWGGGEYSVNVVPWRDEMPGLRHIVSD